MRCLLGVRFNMIATVLNDYVTDTSDVVQEDGHFETVQDPDTGALIKVWISDTTRVSPTPVLPGMSKNKFDMECLVQGFKPGFLSTPNTQSFDNGKYIPMEIVQLIFPPKYVVNRNQYVGSIRNKDNTILWVEEETGLPTVFQIQGVTPNFDIYGRHVDNLAILRRSVSQ
jgi:outer membrane lipoprotein-sorting protein